ncbi:hypothetical protein CHL78_000845 [Romboutsia weinsteinii]|uniref:Uncharacterized protein n=1 Tax=Romboutsia weinsteinii TaxID=2020949 RepID=A0A371JAF2_9FIRM|nr:hypothetical protein [Romboutsia weinsteinii]RDY29749.1 hypothetical protein CHL78_000845 [Romboutsia weinsteinii]
MENTIRKIREDIVNSWEVNINDICEDYDDVIDLIGEYHMEISELYKNYDRYVCCVVNQEYEVMDEELLMNIHKEYSSKVNKKYNVDVDIDSIAIETYFIAIFDDAMYQFINKDNQISIEQIMNEIDFWTKELDDYMIEY